MYCFNFVKFNLTEKYLAWLIFLCTGQRVRNRGLNCIWLKKEFENIEERYLFHRRGADSFRFTTHFEEKAVACEKANFSLENRNLPDRNISSVFPKLSLYRKLDEGGIYKTSRRHSGERGSIGGICIPVLGNPEVSICLFQKTGTQVDIMVTGRYQTPGGQCKIYKTGFKSHGLYSQSHLGLCVTFTKTH